MLFEGVEKQAERRMLVVSGLIKAINAQRLRFKMRQYPHQLPLFQSAARLNLRNHCQAHAGGGHITQ